MTNDPVDGQISRLGPFTKNHFAAPPWNFLVEKKKKKIQIFPFSRALKWRPLQVGRWKRQPIGCWPFSLSLFSGDARDAVYRGDGSHSGGHSNGARVQSRSCHRSATVRCDLYFDWICTIFFGILIAKLNRIFFFFKCLKISKKIYLLFL